jgi:hypothetical protein
VTTTTDADLTRLGRAAWGALEPIHVLAYFAPQPTAAYVELGLHPKLSYFAARSAAFGPVGPEVVTATFYVFAPWLVEATLPAAWDVAGPAQVQTARREGTYAALHDVLGDPDVSEALSIARRVCDGLTAHGRPLYAAHSALDWPEDPLLALWHAASLIREHRGDGHISVLHTADLDPVESLVLGGLYSSNTRFLRKTRGWSDEEWAAAEERLRDRGLVTADGELSDQGRDTRRQIEAQTDRLAVEGWAHVGPDDTRRLHELVAPLQKQVLTSEAMPGWVRSRG